VPRKNERQKRVAYWTQGKIGLISRATSAGTAGEQKSAVPSKHSLNPGEEESCHEWVRYSQRCTARMLKGLAVRFLFSFLYPFPNAPESAAQVAAISNRPRSRNQRSRN
jgi:hypothetical protein